MPEVGLSASSHCQSLIHSSLDGSVFSEATHLQDDILGAVIDVGQEQNWSKDRTLRHPRCHWDLVQFLTLNNDRLLAIA